MIKKRKVKEIVEDRFCDDCGKPASHQCHICYKDLCGWMANGCAVRDDRDDFGDHPDYYCKKCWSIGEPYRKKSAELEEQSWKEIEKWEKEAKRRSKK